jgi:hypothetical protein
VEIHPSVFFWVLVPNPPVPISFLEAAHQTVVLPSKALSCLILHSFLNLCLQKYFLLPHHIVHVGFLEDHLSSHDEVGIPD